MDVSLGGRLKWCGCVLYHVGYEVTCRIVFVVDVWVASEDRIGFDTVASNIELREPVYYKESVMKAETLKQHPELTVLVEGKSWGVDIIEWFRLE